MRLALGGARSGFVVKNVGRAVHAHVDPVGKAGKRLARPAHRKRFGAYLGIAGLYACRPLSLPFDYLKRSSLEAWPPYGLDVWRQGRLGKGIVGHAAQPLQRLGRGRIDAGADEAAQYVVEEVAALGGTWIADQRLK